MHRHVDGVNVWTRRDRIGADGTRRVLLRTDEIRPVPTVRTGSIPATSTPVRPLTCGNAPRGGGSQYRLLFPCSAKGFAVGRSLDVTAPTVMRRVAASHERWPWC